jgi:NIPSNAP
MITCVVEYTIDSRQIAAFEQFARAWIALVNKHGGQHHGYFLPAEGASDRALALFSFPSLARYESYRQLFGADPEFIAADRIRDESGCVLRYERTFMRPLLSPLPARGYVRECHISRLMSQAWTIHPAAATTSP